MASLWVALVAQPVVVEAWQRWEWTGEGPGTRAGHSLHVYKNYTVLFGGRGTNQVVPHQPRTYEIIETAGVLSFETYDQKLVRDCGDDPDLSCLDITVGLYHNDLWLYPLDCDRFDDHGCAFTGWHNLDSGARLGGCEVIDAVEFCTHPSERYDHASALFADGTLVIYGGFSRRCEDFCDDVWSIDLQSCLDGLTCQWRELAVLGREGPGKRWRMSSTINGGDWFIFGGHRMWHGYAQANDVDNRWEDLELYPHGGYLDDLWKYEKDTNTWTQVLPQSSCFAAPGEEWEERNDYICDLFWPSARADAALVKAADMLWLHGGFVTFFPYPHVAARGASAGTARRPGAGDLAPFPTLPFYLDDLWRYNFTSLLWEEITPVSTENPAARRGHSLLLSGQVFLLVGGYATNFYNQEFWIYNMTLNSWLQKTTFNTPLLPNETCTDDVLASIESGTTVMSVKGQPTRFTELDGLWGRATSDVFVPQQRRARPGWDGCRDRFDLRDKREEEDFFSLPNEMVWKQPSQRAVHRVAYHEGFGMMLLYGGDAYVDPQLQELDATRPVEVVGDLWTYSIDKCSRNCSDHGSCFYGFCFCDDGWYGVDCSNVSCPGDFCFYDPLTHVQHCDHCCHASYIHEDGDVYVPNERKVPCDHDHPGESHGICDGFGRCQCAPPFVGEDCSMRDCLNNCSGHGLCSLEYPISRCICDDVYGGFDCSERLCLNNCSYPNGECVDGTCVCVDTFNPYNRSQTWRPWAGTDCSFLTAFAGASIASPSSLAIVWTILMTAVLLRFRDDEALQ